MRDNKQIATNLRELADKYEAEYVGALSFDILGDVFGNTFWNLIAYDRLDMSKLVEAVDNLTEEVSKHR